MRPALLLSLFFCTSVFAAELRFGAERPITPTEIGLAPVAIGPTTIVTDGKDFLVLWLDGRNNQTANIVAARVTADGKVLDPHGIAITRYRQASILDARWNGTEYLVTAGEYVPFQYEQKRHYYAISRDGIVRDAAAPPPAPPAEPTWPLNERGETVTFTGYGKGQHTLWFLDPNGLMAKGVDLPEHYARPTHVIPMANREFAVVFGDGLWALFNRTQGFVRDRALFSAAAGSDWVYATITVSGRRLGSGWIGLNSVKQPDGTSVTRYTAGWTTVDEVGNHRSGRFEDATIVYPLRVIGDGATFHYLASFSKGSDLELRSYRILDGRVDGPFIIDRLTEGEMAVAQSPSMGSNGTRNLLTWLDGCGQPLCRLAFTTFGRGGTPLDNAPSILSWSAKRQIEPAAASGSDGGVLAVWRDASLFPIRGRLTTATSSRMIEVSGRGTAPRVAFAGGTYGVVWYEPDDEQLLLRRFDAAGNAIDADDVVLSKEEDARNYHIVPRGDVLQVAWLGAAASIRTVAVPPTGKVPPSLLVSGGTYDPKRQHILLTSNGNAATIVWTESTKVRNEPLITWRAVRITGPNTLGPVVEVTRTAEDPAIQADTFAAALSDNALLLLLPLASKNGGCLAMQTFTPEGGSTLRYREKLTCTDSGGLPKASLMWDGKQWWAAVQSGGSQFVQSISRDGVPGAKYEVAPADTNPVIHSIVRVPSGIAVVYTRADYAFAGTQRAFIRILTSDPLGKGRAVRH